MKKLICILLTIFVCFTLASCSCAKKNKQESQTNLSSDKEVGEEYPNNWD
jgi:hypothetical protein